MLLLASLGTLQAYEPPRGIPDPADQHPIDLTPGFGWEIDRATPSFPPEWLSGTPSAVANYYYIDKTHPSASNATNGHPGQPRISIPEGALPAGTFIYIHAGTYTSADSGGDRFNWFGVGTSANPIWISGNPSTRPIIQDRVHIGDGGNTSFLIFENIYVGDVSAAFISIAPSTDGHTIDHVLVRNVRGRGTGTAADSSGIGISISQGTDTYPNSTVRDVVIYNNEISHYGNKASSDEAGVLNGMHTRRVWVLNNVIHDVGSDSVAGSHYSNYTDRLTEDYYIGGNTCYGNGENGIDLKNVQRFVISQNTIYGPFARENGWGVVAHYGANAAFKPRNGKIIFNDIYHVSGGIYTGGSSGVDNMDIIGNKIWDVRKAYSVSQAAEDGACIQIDGTTVGANSVFRIVNNTFHDYDRGLLIEPNAGDSFKIHGNIFSSRANPAMYELDVPNLLEPYVFLDHNLYFGTPRFRRQSQDQTLATLQAAGHEANAVVGDPLFVNAAAGNFTLGAGSPAVDKSAAEFPIGDSAYTAFQSALGINIRTDFEGTTRPVDGLWDIGAYEQHIPPNAAPTTLTIP